MANNEQSENATQATEAAAEGAEHVKEAARQKASRLWEGVRNRPAVGFVAAGGAALALASAIGVGEAALALATGYFAYQYMRHGRSPREAMERFSRKEAAEKTSAT
jgi:fructoselysine-6-P-deglycase FrlB-like protein